MYSHGMESKRCPGCIEEKPIELFAKNRCNKDGRQTYCRVCLGKFNVLCAKKYREKNRPRLLAWHEKYRSENPAKFARYDYERRLRNHGWTPLEYEEQLRKQDGVCAICKLPESAKNKNGKFLNLACDHKHSCCDKKFGCTSCRRGLMCSRCNQGLYAVESVSGWLAAATEYLEKYGT